MLLQRTLVALILLPIGIAIIVWGGLAYAALIAIILGVAALEFASNEGTLFGDDLFLSVSS